MNTDFIQKNKKQWFREKKFIIPIVLVLFILLIFTTGALYVKSTIRKPVSTSAEEVGFTIKSGESTQDIGRRLEQDDLIKSSWVFVVYLNFKGQSSSLQAGDYELKRNYSMLEVIEVLTQGKISSGKITIPEGWTNKQIEEEVAKKGIDTKDGFDQVLSKNYDYDFLKESPSGDLQGFLFPETYFLSSRPDSTEVIGKMLKEFSLTADPKIKSGAGTNGLNYYEILTLASIVEREVTNSGDMKKVASVFINRLQNGMTLDSCATVEYVLGTKKRILSAEDIAIDSPYNTYKNAGLPPTPIANPGLTSIEAVLHPAETDYIFFFSGSDGKTYFSKTQEEHEALKAQYL
jgi:UPF0755 protein